MYYFLIRKILYVLLLVTAFLGLIFLGRFLFFSVGIRSTEKKALPPAKVQETLPLPQTEKTPAPPSEKATESPLPTEERQEATKRDLPSPVLPEKDNKPRSDQPPTPKGPAMADKPSRKSEKEAEPPKAPPQKETVPERAKNGEAAKGKKTNGAEGDQKVQKGDSIYTVAERIYGVSNTSIVDGFWMANPRIGNPDLLPVGEALRLPKISEESLVYESVDGLFQIRLGTFSKAEFADYLRRHPLLKDKEIEISPRTTASGKTWFRVTVGRFKDREEALEVVRSLKEQGLSPYFKGFKRKN